MELTRDLTGAALDWAVSKCEGIKWEQGDLDAGEFGPGFKPSTNWADGGPIIEREFITCGWDWSHEVGHMGFAEQRKRSIEWYAIRRYTGPTLLIAAMRCFVASRLGDEVEVPVGLAV